MSINTKKSYLFLSLFFFISLSLRAQDLVPVTKIVDGDTVKIDYKGNIESVRLKFMISGKASTELTLEFMKEELTVHNLEFFDPVYGKK